jgi:phosphohistidine phosphatase SixA
MRAVHSTLATLLAVTLSATGADAQRTRHRATPQPTTVILVRHAEKFTGNPLDQNPPLTPEGWARARDLYRLLKSRHVDAIITTQLDRTKMTARPTADSLHLTPEVVEMGRDARANAAAVASLIRARHAGQTVLVVGHSTTVPQIIADLGGPALGEICESAYSNVFTLVVPRTGAPRLAHVHFGSADPPGGHECVDGLRVAHHGR